MALHSTRNKQMAKHTKNVPAITEAAKQAGRQIALSGLAGRRVAALQAEGDRIAASINGGNRSLRLVSTEGQFSALIKHGKTTLQFEGNSFAVTTHD
jgi:hypothetical protein